MFAIKWAYCVTPHYVKSALVGTAFLLKKNWLVTMNDIKTIHKTTYYVYWNNCLSVFMFHNAFFIYELSVLLLFSQWIDGNIKMFRDVWFFLLILHFGALMESAINYYCSHTLHNIWSQLLVKIDSSSYMQPLHTRGLSILRAT